MDLAQAGAADSRSTNPGSIPSPWNMTYFVWAHGQLQASTVWGGYAQEQGLSSCKEVGDRQRKAPGTFKDPQQLGEGRLPSGEAEDTGSSSGEAVICGFLSHPFLHRPGVNSAAWPQEEPNEVPLTGSSGRPRPGANPMASYQQR